MNTLSEKKPDSVDPAVAAGVTPADGAAPPPASTDPDDIALQEALAAAQAEEAAAKATGTETVGEPPSTEALQKDRPSAGKPVVPSIPKPRFDEALARAEKAEREAAYFRGVAEARQAPQQPYVAPQPTPAQSLSTIDQKIDALAAKFDAGEITMADYKREERTLTREADTIREDVLVAKVKPAIPQAVPPSDDFYLDAATEQIASAHPWVNVFEQAGNDAHWNFLRDAALVNLKERGIDPEQRVISNRDRYELRAEIARLADEYGPGLVGKAAQAKGIALPGPSSPSQQQQPKPLSPDALARQAKLGQHALAPPSLASMSGSTSPTSGEPSVAQLEAMTDDDYDKLPAVVRNKLRGIA